MSIKFSGIIEVLRIWLFVAVILIGIGLNGAIASESTNVRGSDGGENWNYVSAGHTPDNPTSDDTVTFKVEVNNKANITKVQIYICTNNICKTPVQMDDSDNDKIYIYKSIDKFAENSKINYRFTLHYDNKTDVEKVPASSATSNVAKIAGSLYFEFYIGENWNFKSASINPSAPTDSDKVEFKLELNEKEPNIISDVRIEIVQLEPSYFPELFQTMNKTGDTTYTYTHNKLLEGDAKIGYRFHILYEGVEDYETIPISSSTSNVVEEEGELFFAFTVEKTGGTDGNGGDEGDEGGFLPGFEVAVTLISLMAVIIIHMGFNKKGLSRRGKSK